MPVNRTTAFPRATLFTAAAIIISSSFTLQLSKCAKAVVGDGGFMIVLFLGFVIFASFLFRRAWKNKPGLFRQSLFSVVLAAGLYAAWQAKVDVEKTHMLLFGLLGWYAHRDFWGRRDVQGTMVAFLVVLCVSLLDEFFQALLPYRVFDWLDSIRNAIGGIWGLILYYISHK